MQNLQTINIFADFSSCGGKVYENLPVLHLGRGNYRLLSSPGLILGLAKNDEIKFDEKSCEFELLKRGGNFCVQVYLSPDGTDQVDKLIRDVKDDLNGTHDGETSKLLIFSIPVQVGFVSIRSLFDKFVDSSSDAEWYYGNIHDNEDGVTLLNWWNDFGIYL